MTKLKLFALLFFIIHVFLSFGQDTKVDFQNITASLSVKPTEKSIQGKVQVRFRTNVPQDSIVMDAKNMRFDEVKIKNQNVNFKSTSEHLIVYHPFKKGTYQLHFSYQAKPKQTLYFIDIENDFQIWTQGQGKYTSHWLPSIDDVNDKMIFKIAVAFDPHYTVISNGLLKEKKVDVASAKCVWHYEMQKPMSSYLVMLAIGTFDSKTEKTKSGTPLEYYLSIRDKNHFSTTYRYSKEIFDFFETQLGVKYPWEIYRQVPVRDFLYAGMENTTSTIFSQDFVVDSIGFHDKTYINVNAHELAHQWFGNLITAKSGEHHWLQEGFATYFALLAEQKLFGEDHFYWELYEMAERIQKASADDKTPMLSKDASSLTYYQKGAWALFDLHQQIGDKKFQKAIKNYLKKYAFQTVETQDFLSEIQKVADFDIQEFEQKWLTSTSFPIQDALNQIKKNKAMETYFNLIEKNEVAFLEKKEYLINLFENTQNSFIQEEICYQLNNVPFAEAETLTKLALHTKNWKVRQALARSLSDFPEDFLSDYETFLEDPSYITREIALGTLWSKFPEKRTQFLEKSKHWMGFQDRNLRILWLTLALITVDYENQNKVDFYDELLSYSSSKFDSNTRMNAFNNLLYINPNDTNIFKNLLEATTHHKWQFTLFARNRIKELFKSELHLKYFQSALENLPADQKRNLQKLLDARK